MKLLSMKHNIIHIVIFIFWHNILLFCSSATIFHPVSIYQRKENFEQLLWSQWVYRLSVNFSDRYLLPLSEFVQIPVSVPFRHTLSGAIFFSFRQINSNQTTAQRSRWERENKKRSMASEWSCHRRFLFQSINWKQRDVRGSFSPLTVQLFSPNSLSKSL